MKRREAKHGVLDLDAQIRAAGGRPPRRRAEFKLFPPTLAGITLDNDALSLEPTPGSYIMLVELRGRPRVLVDITESKNQDDARKAVTEAFGWRQRVLEKLGPWLEDGPDAVVATILQNRGRLRGPAIAARINQAMGARLQEALAMRNDGRGLPSQMLLGYVRGVLTVFEGQEDAHNDIAAALDRIQSGKNPFLPNAPVTGRMVGAVLKSKRGKLIRQHLQTRPLADRGRRRAAP